MKALRVRVDCLRTARTVCGWAGCTGKHVSLRGSMSLVQNQIIQYKEIEGNEMEKYRCVDCWG